MSKWYSLKINGGASVPEFDGYVELDISNVVVSMYETNGVSNLNNIICTRYTAGVPVEWESADNKMDPTYSFGDAMPFSEEGIIINSYSRFSPTSNFYLLTSKTIDGNHNYVYKSTNPTTQIQAEGAILTLLSDSPFLSLTYVFTDVSAGYYFFNLPLSGTTQSVTIDWGDGTAPFNYSGGIIENQSYNYFFKTPSPTVNIKVSGSGITQLNQYFSDGVLNPSAKYLTRCDSFGEIGLTNLSYAFWMCSNLTFVPPTLPIYSTITIMDDTFYDAFIFKSPIDQWDVSDVTTMLNLVANASDFNQNLGSWDVRNANMKFMFADTRDYTTVTTDVFSYKSYNKMSIANYNATLNGWASLGTGWHSGNIFVTDCLMYTDATSRNKLATYIPMGGDVYIPPGTNVFGSFRLTYNYQDKSSVPNSVPSNYTWKLYIGDSSYNIFTVSGPKIMFDVSGVTTQDFPIKVLIISPESEFVYHFLGNFASNPSNEPPFSLTYDFSDISGSYDYYLPLAGKSVTGVTIDWGDGSSNTVPDGSFNQYHHTYTIANINDSSGVTINVYGSGITDLTHHLNPSAQYLKSCNSFGEIGLTNLQNAFADCISLISVPLTLPISSAVTNMYGMFYITNVNNETNFDQDLSSWDVSSVTDMGYMFLNRSSFKGSNIDQWNVSNVNNMNHMFSNTKSFNQDLGSWNLLTGVTMINMFDGALGMTVANYNATLKGWADKGYTSDTFTAKGLIYSHEAISYRNTFLPSSTNYVNDLLIDLTLPFNENTPIFNATFKGQITSGVTPYIQFQNNPKQGYSSLAGNTIEFTDISFNPPDETLMDVSVKIYQNSSESDPGIFIGLLKASDLTIDETFSLTYEFIGTSNYYDFNLPLAGTSVTGVIIDWGDGSSNTVPDGSFNLYPHRYEFIPEQDKKPTIKVYGNGITYFSQYLNDENSSAQYLKSCDSFGEIGLTDLDDAFHSCTKLTTVPSALPQNSTVTTMNSMFQDSSFNGDISNWNVSGVTVMTSMFENASFNGDISNWNVSGVTVMTSMFENAIFNGDIGNWDVSGVTNMSSMFQNTTNFNQDLSGWKVNNVSMLRMFTNAKKFNGDLSNWNVSKVLDMRNMFQDTPNFEGKGLDTWIWDNPVPNTMVSMFEDATAFNVDISGWNVSKVTQMNTMFANTPNFNQNLGNWDISGAVGSMNGMFDGALGMTVDNYNKTLIGWAEKNYTSDTFTAKGLIYSYVAKDARPLFATSLDVGDLYIESMLKINENREFNATYYGDTSFTAPFKIKVNGDTDQSGELIDSTIYFKNVTFDLPHIDGSNVHVYIVDADNGNIFNGLLKWSDLSINMNFLSLKYDLANAESGFIFNLPLAGTSVTGVNINWGDGSSNTVPDGSFFKLYPHTYLFAQEEANKKVTITVDGSGITQMSQDLSGANPSAKFLTSCESFGEIGLTSLYAAFEGCEILTSVPPTLPSTVNDTRYMFYKATNFNQDLSGWVVDNVINMAGMFGTTKFNGNLAEWNVSKVENMTFMFTGSRDFEGKGLDTWKWINPVPNTIAFMFTGATAFNVDISGWNVSRVTDMSNLFNGATSFNQDLGSWNLLTDVSMNGMFDGALGMTVDNYNKTLIGWAEKNYTSDTFTAKGLIYSYVAKDARPLFATSSDVRDLYIESLLRINEKKAFNATYYGDISLNETFNIQVDTELQPYSYVSANTIDFTDVTFDHQLDGVDVSVNIVDGNSSNVFTGLLKWSDLKITDYNPLVLTYDFTDVSNGNYSFQLPLSENFTEVNIDWGFDGDTNRFETFPDGIPTPPCIHTYHFKGTDVSNIVITVDGSGITQLSQELSGISNPSAQYLKSCDTFGEIGLTDLSGAFQNCTNLISVPETLPTTSTITTMSNTFNNSSINKNLNGWDVSGVTTMQSMFQNASVFNKNLAGWNVSKVADMDSMFEDATAFEGTGLDSWIWGNPVANTMVSMFEHANAFNGNISSWNVSKVTNMSSMFQDANSFNGDLGNWDVSGVANMSDMFNGATNFVGTTLENWTVTPTTTNMTSMFQDTTKFNANLGSWNISGAEGRMVSMFQQALGMTVYNYNQTLIGWVDSSYTSGTFTAEGLIYSYEGQSARDKFTTNTDVGDLYIKSVWPINENKSFNATFNIQQVDGTMNYYIQMDDGGHQNSEVVFDGDTVKFTQIHFSDDLYTEPTDVSINIYKQTGDNVFTGLLKESDLTTTDPSNVPLSLTYTFLSDVDTSPYNYPFKLPLSASSSDVLIDWGFGSDTERYVRVPAGSFVQLYSHTYTFTNQKNTVTITVDGSGIEHLSHYLGNVQNTSAKFLTSCTSFGEIGLNNLSNAFRDCILLFSVPDRLPQKSTVTNMNSMFQGAIIFNDHNNHIGNWDVSSVTNMTSMFYGAIAFKGSNIGQWTIGASNMNSMFRDAIEFNQDLSSWGVSGVTNMGSMFFGALKFKGTGLDQWTLTTQPNIMSNMFKDTRLFDANLGSWNVSDASMNGMFDNALGMTVANYNATLNGWAGYTSSDFTAKGLIYSEEAFSARESFPGSTNENVGDLYIDSPLRINENKVFDATYHGDVSGNTPLFTIQLYRLLENSDPQYSSSNTDTTIEFLDVSFNIRHLPFLPVNVNIVDSDSANVFTGLLKWSDLSLDLFDPLILTYEFTDVSNSSYLFQLPLATTLNATGVSIDWGDETTTYVPDGSFNALYQHYYDFTDEEKRTVIIQVDASGITHLSQDLSGANPSAQYLKSCDSFGEIGLTDLTSAFNGCIKLTTVPLKLPILSTVTSMNSTFKSATTFDQDLSGWLVNTVTDMTDMFKDTDHFNQNLGNWDITGALDSMGGMMDQALGMTVAKYNDTLNGWADSSYSSGSFTATGLIYSFEAKDARPLFATSENVGDLYIYSSLLINENRPFDAMYYGDTTAFNGKFKIKVNSDNLQDSSSNTDTTIYFTDVIFDLPHNDASNVNVTIVDGSSAIVFNGLLKPPDLTLKDFYPLKLTYNLSTEYGPYTFNLPLSETSNEVDIDWGFEGDPNRYENCPSGIPGSFSHIYNFVESPGFQTVTITVDGSGIEQLSQVFNGVLNLSSGSLMSCESFGEIGLTNLSSAFNGCSILTSVPSMLPLRTTVTNMNSMFQNALTFDQDLSGWLVNEVTDMGSMFNNAELFQGTGLGEWKVSNVADMSSMFASTGSFQGTGLDKWNVSGATDMSVMFSGATIFDSDLGNWDVSGVTDMNQMFENASAFKGTNIDKWNVAKTENMNNMFEDATSFNANLGGWDLTSVIASDSMAKMLDGALGMTVDNYNKTLKGWNDNGYQCGSFTAKGLIYSKEAYFARQSFTDGNEDVNDLYIESLLKINENKKFNATYNGDHDVGSSYYIEISGNSVKNDSVTSSTIVFEDVTFQPPTYDNPTSVYIYIHKDSPTGNKIFTGFLKEVDLSTESTNPFSLTYDFSSVLNNDPKSTYDYYLPLASDISSSGVLIHWGDGFTDYVTDGSFDALFYHEYTREDIYDVTQVNVTVNGLGINQFSQYLNNEINSSAEYLTRCDSFGEIGLTNLSHAFYQCYRLTDVSNALPNTTITNMEYMFSGASIFNGEIGNWDVSGVTTMSNMFESASGFNGDIGNWNVSNVTDMSSMFENATAFNQDISGWKVDIVTDMSSMFQNATAFNQNISGWKVDIVNTMANMFNNTTTFNQNLGSWNVDGTTMIGMFDQALGMTVDNYNKTLNGWHTAGYSSTSFTARGLIYSFDAIPARDKFALSHNVGDLYIRSFLKIHENDLFDATYNRAGDETYPTYYIKVGIHELNQQNSSLAQYTVDFKYITFQPPDYGVATDVSINIYPTDVKFGTGTIFSGLLKASDLTTDRLPNTLSLTYNFPDDVNASYHYQLPLTGTSGEVIIDWGYGDDEARNERVPEGSFTMLYPHIYNFQEVSNNIVTITVSGNGIEHLSQDLSGVLNPSRGLLTSCNSFGEIGLTNLSYAFYQCTRLTDVSNALPKTTITNMESMFSGASIFNGEIGNWDVSGVNNMSGMFQDASGFNGDIGNWDVSGVTNMSLMFKNASSFDQDLNGWTVDNVNDMSSMFQNANSFNGNLATWNVSTVTDMSGMFFGATSFEGSGLTTWNLSTQPITMNSMFQDATIFNEDISGWVVDSVTDMTNMFKNTTTFNQNLGGWNITNTEGAMSGMMDKALGMTVDNYNKTLNGWISYSSDSFTARGLIYSFDAIPARTNFATSQDVGDLYIRSFWQIHENDLFDATYNGTAIKDKPYYIRIAEHGLQDSSSATSFSIDFKDVKFSDEFYNEPTDVSINIYSTLLGSGTGDIFSGFLKSYDLRIDPLRDPLSLTYVFPFKQEKSYTLNLPLSGASGEVIVDWGYGVDEIPERVPAGTFTQEFAHTYNFSDAVFPVTVTVTVDGSGITQLNQMFNTQNTCAQYLTRCNSFGDIGLTDLGNAFRECTILTDVPSILPVGVTNMAYMFYEDSSFNGDIGSWIVSDVTDMQYMFENATSFNGNLGNWDVSGVANMNSMFVNATSFEGTTLQNWKVSSTTTDMINMFNGASKFNTNLGSWNISGASDKMGGMLDHALGMTVYNYNYTLKGWADSSYSSGSFTAQDLIFTEFALESRTYFALYHDVGDLCIHTTYQINENEPFSATYNGITSEPSYYIRIGNSPEFKEYDSTSTNKVEFVDVSFDKFYDEPTDVSINIYSSSTPSEPTGDIFSGLLKQFDLTTDSKNPFTLIYDFGSVGTPYDYYLPLSGTLSAVKINWGDGMIEDVSANQFSASYPHMYSEISNNIITITVDGRGIDQMSQDLSGAHPSAGLLTSCTSFGQIDLTNLTNAFHNCTNLTTVPNSLPIGIRTMNSMFRGASKFDQDLSGWVVDSIEDMASMFQDATSYKGTNLKFWNVTSTKSINSMFKGATEFDSDIGRWNVSGVTDMSGVFQDATNFEQDLSGWVVDNVTTMDSMFANATKFKGSNIDQWKVTKVANMNNMFNNATSFNANLGSWDVSGVADYMTGMFDQALGMTVDNYNNTLIGWNDSGYKSQTFTAKGLIYSYDAETARNNFATFHNVGDLYIRSFLKINENDVFDATYKGTNDQGTYYIKMGTGSLQDSSFATLYSIEFTDVSFGPIYYTDTADISINIYKTLSGTGNIFSGLLKRPDLTIDPSTDPLSLTYVFPANITTNYTLNLPLSGSPGEVIIDWGYGVDSHERVPAGSFTQEYAHTYSFASGDLPVTATITVDGSGITQLKQLFQGETNGNASANYLKSCNSFGEIGLTDLGYAFSECSNLIDVPLKLPVGVTIMNNMFEGASSFDGDLGSWDVSGVKDMSYMFNTASDFKGTTINQWTITATDMNSMFENATSFDSDLGSWDVSGVKDMNSMFDNATAFVGTTLENWNVTSITTDMTNMFKGASKFNANLGSWNISGASDNMGGMFDHALGMTVDNYNKTLIGWDTAGYRAQKFSAYGLIYSTDALIHRTNFTSDNVDDMYINSYWRINENTPFDASFNINTSDEDGPFLIKIGEGNRYPSSSNTNQVIAFEDVSFDKFYSIPTNVDITVYKNTTTQIFYGILKEFDLTTGNPLSLTYDFSDTSGSYDYYLPLASTELTNGVVINWGDGASTIVPDGSSVLLYLHTYTFTEASNNIITITVDGSGITQMSQDLSGANPSAGLLTSCNSFGEIGLTDLSGAFHGCIKLTTVPPILPVTTSITTMHNMFNGATIFNSDVTLWEVDHVTDMTAMFQNASTFNQHLDSWDISNAKASMANMLDNALGMTVDNYNKTLNGWYDRHYTSETFTAKGLIFSQDAYNARKVFSSNNVGDLYIHSLLLINENRLFDVTYYGNTTTFTGPYTIQLNNQTPKDSFSDDSTTIDFRDVKFDPPDDPLVPVPIHIYDKSNNVVFYGILKEPDLTIDALNSFSITYEFEGIGPYTFNLPLAPSPTTQATDVYIVWGFGDDSHERVPDGSFNALYEHQYNFTESTTYVTITVDGKNIDRFSQYLDDAVSANASAKYLTSCNSFGEIGLNNLTSAFETCIKLTRVPSLLPNEEPIAFMKSMFQDATSFDQDLSGWIVTTVTDMDSMFSGASLFNGNLTSWNVSIVENMNNMFDGASMFEGTGLDTWIWSNYTVGHENTMDSMFQDASSFNQNISGWSVDKVTSMDNMFHNATSFDCDLSGWVVTNVTSMNSMFLNDGVNVSKFNGNVANWNVSKVTSMDSMFQNAVAFVGNGIDTWEWEGTMVPNSMNNMFNNATSFNQNLARWNVSTSVGNMAGMFDGALGMTVYNYNQTLLGWDAKHYTSDSFTAKGLIYSYEGATPRTNFAKSSNVGDLYIKTNWLINENKLFDAIYYGDTTTFANDYFKLRFRLDDEYTSTIIEDNTIEFTQAKILPDYPVVDVSVNIVDSSEVNVFSGVLKKSDLTNKDAQEILSLTYSLPIDPSPYPFYLPLTGTSGEVIVDWGSGSDTERYVVIQDGSFNTLLYHEYTFTNPTDTTITITVDGSGIQQLSQYLNGDTINSSAEHLISCNSFGEIGLTDLTSAFHGCKRLIDVPPKLPSKTTITSMNSMFQDAIAFNDNDISGWLVNEVTDMSYMFYGASSFDGDLGSWNVSKVADMDYMFHRATDFTGTTINQWTITATTMSSMFESAHNFVGDLGNWDVSGVTIMNSMFDDATAFVGTTIAQWNVAKTTNMNAMFKGTNKFNANLGSWDVSGALGNMGSMFDGALGMTVDNYNKTLNGWHDNKYTSGTFTAKGLIYSYEAYSARNIFATSSDVGDLYIQSFWKINENKLFDATFNTDGTAGINYYIQMDNRGRQTSELSTNLKVDFKDVSFNPMHYDTPTEVNINIYKDQTGGLPVFTGLLKDVDLTTAPIREPLSLTYTFDASAPRPYSFYLPLTGTSGDVFIDWGYGEDDVRHERVPDGSFNTLYYHEYDFVDASNTVIITVDGSGIQQLSQYLSDGFNSSSTYLTSCNSFGEIGLTNLQYAFYMCANLTSVPEKLPLNSTITNMIGMFSSVPNFDQNLVGWDVSGVKYMTSMFAYTGNFNGNLAGWNVSNVSSMSGMFLGAIEFEGNGLDTWIWTNKPIGYHNTMDDMFQNTKAFNGDISSWDVLGVTNMSQMFMNATIFNSDISEWTVYDVTDMTNMFANTSNFDQNLGSWNITNATGNMAGMFDQALGMTVYNYNATINAWYSKGYRSSTFTANGLIYSNEGDTARTIFVDDPLPNVGDLFIKLPLLINENSQSFDATYNGINITPGKYYITFNDSPAQESLLTTTNSKTIEFTSLYFNHAQYATVEPINIKIYSDQNTTNQIFNGLLKEPDLSTVCFNEGTKILYLNKQMKDEYIKIESLRAGDFVKTYKHGYRKIDLIGRNILINNPNIYSKCMYKMEKTETNGLTEDLIVTGGHSILVDHMTEEEKELNEQLFWGPTPMLDKKYLLLSAVSKQFTPMKNKKPYVYYHLVLDNEEEDEARYGIWANGILTETPSKEYFKKQKFILL
jgi:surface protein